MADQPNAAPPPQRPAMPPKPAKSAPPPDAGHIPITEEMDRAKWTLPPAPVIVIGVVVVGIVLALFSYFGRSKPVAQGAVNEVYSVASSDSSVLVLINFSLTNVTEKPVTIKQLEGVLNAGGKEMIDDHAASAIDYPRYVKAFPGLGEHAQNAVMPETKIAPGARIAGSALFSFDITKDAFDSRQSIALRVVPYDRPAFELQENRGSTAK